ncbi:MAG: LLM class flavin-dependent oxidoreductase [Dehalococcoidia bacterium]|nr:LLM class flavin-dependent oxidoreductase [Dehalococcoidia bacterium]
MTTQRLHIGVLLPTRGVLLRGERPPQADLVLRVAERAEELGLDSVWVGDSLTSKPRLDPLVALAAVAARTERVGLGTAVLLGALYQPVLLARTAASVDLLSKGRLTLAMGVGGAFTPDQQQEWAHAGVPRTQRAGRLEEVVQIMKRLWTEEVVTFQGRHFTLDNVRLEPRPYRPKDIPIWLNCHYRTDSDAQLERVVRLGDGFIAITDQPPEYAQVVQQVRGRAQEAGRDGDSLARAFYMTVNLNADPEAAWREADAFIRAYYGVNFWAETWGPFGRPEAVAQRMREYAQAGAQHLIVRFASLDPLGQLETFAREVLPIFRQERLSGEAYH